MPLRNSSGALLAIAVAILYLGALVLIVDGFYIVITGVSNDALIYVSATILATATVAVVLSFMCLIGGHAIVWATHFMCVADRRRAAYAIAQKAAKHHVEQYVSLRR